jgi:hypothetical protein
MPTRAREAAQKRIVFSRRPFRTLPTLRQSSDATRSDASDASFSEALARARKAQAEVWADEVKEISDSDLKTHEAIGKARLQTMSRLALAGAYNSQFNTKNPGVNVAIGVSIALPEQERIKLIKRRDEALMAGATDTNPLLYLARARPVDILLTPWPRKACLPSRHRPRATHPVVGAQLEALRLLPQNSPRQDT